MSFEVKGKLEVIFEENRVSDKFKKREFVLEVQDGMYSEHIKFQLVQDKCSLIDNFKEGQEIKVSFNLKGRPYSRDGQTTYFTNLDAWRIEGVSGGTDAQNSAAVASNAAASSVSASDTSEVNVGVTFTESKDDDDLPF